MTKYGHLELCVALENAKKYEDMDIVTNVYDTIINRSILSKYLLYLMRSENFN